jgi:DNA-binding SARP family transcriptional activator
MPLQHMLHPSSGLRDGVVRTFAQLHLDGLELGSHALLNRLAPLALSAARVLTRDAELRLMWDEAPDNGAELRKFVASLQTALAE